MDLVVEACEELAGIGLGATCAHETGAAGCAAGDGQELGARLAIGRGGRVDLDEVGTQAQGDAGGTGDEIGGLLVGDGLATRIDPQHDEQALGHAPRR